MHREADGARLVGNGPANSLANPPGGISGKFVAAAVLKLVHRLHDTDVALLNQVEEPQPAIGILFGDGNHEAQVGLNELMLGLLRVHLGVDYVALRPLQVLKAHASIALQPFQVGAMPPLFLTVIFSELFAARALNLRFEVADPAVERAHDVHRFVHPIDHAFAL